MLIQNNFLKYIFYNINDNLEPDWEDINSKIKNNNISAIMVVHYFGMPQDVSKYKKIANEHNLYLIEDNAHGYLGRYDNGDLIGTQGDFSITCPRKHLNLFSGGLLTINKNNSDNLNNLTKDLEYKKININYFKLRQKIKKIKLLHFAYSQFKKIK